MKQLINQLMLAMNGRVEASNGQRLLCNHADNYYSDLACVDADVRGRASSSLAADTSHQTH